MSENGENGANLGEIPHELLIDELVLTFDRADGSLKVTGRIVNFEVGLMIAQRAVHHFETQLRLTAALQAKQSMVDTQRVQDLLNRTRGGRG